jgi:hypothetical protein
VLAFFHLIHPQAAVLDGGVGVFDAGGEKKLGVHEVGWGQGRQREGTQMKKPGSRANAQLPGLTEIRAVKAT